MNYQECLKYLLSLQRSGIKLGLDNTARLLEYFDNPQTKTRTVHIAGTNGKGSTAAYVESILRSAGLRVGLYTSPHLLDFRERIQVNRKLISPASLVRLVERVHQAVEVTGVAATYFEFTTVMAFLHFQDQSTDWNVIEVGMGGRLDSTNLCRAEVCAIPSISLDHESSLGTDLESIAFEKAAIIKNPGTVIAGNLERKLFQVVSKQAQAHNCRVWRWGDQFWSAVRSHNDLGLTFDYSGCGLNYNYLKTNLLGRHQAENAAVAIAVAQAAGHYGVTISEQAIRRGIENAHWPGRLELVSRKPILLLDGAHNPASVKKLAESLEELFPDHRRIVVLGVMKDKPLSEIIEIMSIIADHIILTQPRQERSLDPMELRKLFANSIQAIEIIVDIPEALAAAKKLADDRDLICVTGSLFTVAEAKQALEF